MRRVVLVILLAAGGSAALIFVLWWLGSSTILLALAPLVWVLVVLVGVALSSSRQTSSPRGAGRSISPPSDHREAEVIDLASIDGQPEGDEVLRYEVVLRDRPRGSRQPSDPWILWAADVLADRPGEPDTTGRTGD